MCIFNKGRNEFFLKSTGEVAFYTVAGGSVLSSLTVSESWHSVAVVSSGANKSFFIDGVSAGSGSVATDSWSGTAYIGQYTAGGLERFKGKIGLIFIFNRALTESEIQQLANGSDPKSILPDYNQVCVLDYRPSNTTVQNGTITDLSPQGNNGTLVNGVALIKHGDIMRNERTEEILSASSASGSSTLTVQSSAGFSVDDMVCVWSTDGNVKLVTTITSIPDGTTIVVDDASEVCANINRTAYISHNLLANPDFEEGTVHWTNVTNATTSEETSTVKVNSKALRVSNTSTYHGNATQSIGNAESKSYTLRGWVLPNQIDYSGAPVIRIGSYPFATAGQMQLVAGQWKFVELTYEGTDPDVILYVTDNEADDYIIWDSPQLIENLVANPGMESASDWTGGSQSDTTSHSGTHSWAIGANGYMRQQISSLSDNTQYEVTLWARGQSSNATITVEFSDASGNNTQAITSKSVSTSFQRISAVVSFSNGSNKYLNIRTDNAAYIDDVTVRPLHSVARYFNKYQYKRNIIENAGFESGDLSNWTESGDVNASIVSNDCVEGNYALKLAPTSSGFVKQTLSPNPGTDYLVSFAGYTSNASHPCKLSLLGFANPSSSDYEVKKEINATSWDYEEFVYTVTEPQYYCQVELHGNQSGVSYYYDDLKMIQSLIKNGSFALGDENWSATGSPTVDTSATGRTNCGIRINGDSSNYISQKVNVDSEKLYMIVGYIKCGSANAGIISLSGGASKTLNNGSNTTDWVRVSQIFKPSSSSVTIKLYGNGTTAYFDDVALIELDEADAYWFTEGAGNFIFADEGMARVIKHDESITWTDSALTGEGVIADKDRWSAWVKIRPNFDYDTSYMRLLVKHVNSDGKGFYIYYNAVTDKFMFKVGDRNTNPSIQASAGNFTKDSDVDVFVWYNRNGRNNEYGAIYINGEKVASLDTQPDDLGDYPTLVKVGYDSITTPFSITAYGGFALEKLVIATKDWTDDEIKKIFINQYVEPDNLSVQMNTTFECAVLDFGNEKYFKIDENGNYVNIRGYLRGRRITLHPDQEHESRLLIRHFDGKAKVKFTPHYW